MKKNILNIFIGFVVVLGLAGLEWGHFKINESMILQQYYYQRIYKDIQNARYYNRLDEDVIEFVERAFPEMPGFSRVKSVFEGRTSGDRYDVVDLSDFSVDFPDVRSSREVWAVYFYELGKSLYLQDQEKQAEIYMLLSVKVAPYWSYFWVELGNYYARMGDFERSKSVGLLCLNYPSMRDHCSRYFDEKGLIKKTYDVGFLIDGIKNNVQK